MQNGFSCYYNKTVGERDEKVTAVLRIDEGESGIEMGISRKEATKWGSSFEVHEESELKLQALSVDQVLGVTGLLEDWLKSESRPTTDVQLTDVGGVHIRKDLDSYGSHSQTETEFNDFTVAVSGRDIKFSYWYDTAEEWREIAVPSCENAKRGVSQDYRNVQNVYDTIYDFFTVEYSGQVSYFQEEEPVSGEKTAVHQIEQIFNQFGEISIPLQERRSDRKPLTMDDEADVQYLLHGLLKLHFDDVRREPHTERHSSVSPRIDFLIQNETIGVEVKRASPTRQEHSLRSELAEDKEQYRLDTNIDTLLVFVFDPEKQIGNKAEFEDSFEQETSQMETRVTVTR